MKISFQKAGGIIAVIHTKSFAFGWHLKYKESRTSSY